MTTLLEALAKRAPKGEAATIVHGDYRLDNVVVDMRGEPRITAVLDWELCTLGDPLADLGTAIAYWHDEGDAAREHLPVAVGVTAWPGFPTATQFAASYGRVSTRPWLLLGPGHSEDRGYPCSVHGRYLSGYTVVAGYERAGAAVPFMITRALQAALGQRAVMASARTASMATPGSGTAGGAAMTAPVGAWRRADDEQLTPIMSAARDLFYHVGFHRTTVRDTAH
jgi:hypothetical protein